MSLQKGRSVWVRRRKVFAARRTRRAAVLAMVEISRAGAVFSKAAQRPELVVVRNSRKDLGGLCEGWDDLR